MKAARINEFGGVNVIEVSEIPTPGHPGAGMVKIKVAAASLNPIDTAVREGYTQAWAPVELPLTLGSDAAGTVEEVGEGVKNIAVGDRVYGQASVLAGGSGSLAEFAIMPTTLLSRCPANATFLEAASLPLAGVSALQAIGEIMNVQPGQKILILGAAGGIGSLAVQLAKHAGAYVVAMAGARHLDLVKELGADEAFDYKLGLKSEENYDFIFDTAGGGALNETLPLLRADGLAVSIAGQADEELASRLGLRLVNQNTQVTAERLAALAELVEAGAVKPVIDRTFDLDEVQTAFQTRDQESIAGKVVIAIGE